MDAQQAKAVRLAKHDTPAAREAARGIADPWRRAQALAWVARYAADEDVLRIARESLDAASRCQEPFQSTAAAGWPIRALIERGHGGPALDELDRLVAALPDVQPDSSRSEALFLLFQAGFRLGPEVACRLARLLLAIHEESRHWRTLRNLADALAMLAGQDPKAATALARSISDEWSRRKAERRLAAHASLKPRQFFW